jgi:cell volume regulation protein A
MLRMSEIADFATVLVLASAGLALAAASTKLTQRIPVPTPAIFLVGAAAASDLWPTLYRHVPVHTVERVAVVALIMILFNGGMDVGWRRFHAAAPPILSLGILGTFATAAVVALVAHFLLGLDWTLAGLVGAALSPTDPAVMFSVLGRHEIGGRSGTVLEGEAGMNDPAGIALMLGMIEFATRAHASLLVVVREFAIEMTVGAVIGLAGAVALVWLLRRIELTSEGLYPVLTLVLALLLYGATALAHGSGFLAVFIAGLVLGDARTPYKGAIERFHGSLASLAEVTVFVALGLTIAIGSLGARIWLEGVVLLVTLALFARPLAVAALLAPLRLRSGERAFIAWSGLKGAVPILLAAFAVLEHVDGAAHVYRLVFVVVLLSVVVQGTLVPRAAASLKVPMRERAPLPWELSLRLEQQPQGAYEFVVRHCSRADDTLIRELPLGDTAWLMLVVRGGRPIRPAGSLRLQADDRVLLLVEPEDVEPLGRLFARPAG